MRARWFFSLLTAACVCWPLTTARAQTLVLPPIAASQEGNSSISGPLSTTAATIQWLFDNTTDPVLFAGDTLTGISFVQDGPFGVPNFTGGVYSDWTLTISTTTKTADALSAVFADNIEPDAVVVMSGALTIDDNSFPANASPIGKNDFGPELTFSDPFAYQSGNLLFTLTHSARTGDDLVLDAVEDSHYQYFAADGASTPEATFAAMLMPVMQVSLTFGADVPEPASASLVVAAVIGVAARRRNRSGQ